MKRIINWIKQRIFELRWGKDAFVLSFENSSWVRGDVVKGFGYGESVIINHPKKDKSIWCENYKGEIDYYYKVILRPVKK